MVNTVCLSSDKRDKWGQTRQMSPLGDGDKPPLIYDKGFVSCRFVSLSFV